MEKALWTYQKYPHKHSLFPCTPTSFWQVINIVWQAVTAAASQHEYVQLNATRNVNG